MMSFLCQKSYANCNTIFIKSCSVPDSQFSVLSGGKRSFSVFSMTAAQVTFLSNAVELVRFTGVFIFVCRCCI